MLRHLLPAIALLALPGCGRGGHRPVTILVAASAKDAVEEAARLFEAETGTAVRVAAGPSSALARQIVEGAPADLFLSASGEWTDFLEARGLALATRALVGNDLVVVVPRGNPARVRVPRDLESPAVKHVALAGESVPAGKYAEEALRAAGVLDRLLAEGRIARGHDVRAALAHVERGEAQAGVVYATDALACPGVERAFTFDAGSHAGIVYPLVLLVRSAGRPEARALHEWLASDRAAPVFEKHGFRRAGPPTALAPAVPAGAAPGRMEIQAVRLSLQVAGAAVILSLPFGIALGWLMARRRFRGKLLVETAINLPLVLPPVVTGWLLLVAFGERGWIGRWLEEWIGLRVVFTWKGAAIASAVMAFPLMVRSIRLGFAAVDERLELAARTLGAGPLDAFLTVSLPLARHGIVAGSILAFARSMGEFGATLMIAGSIPGETRTVPLEIYSLLESPGGSDGVLRLVVVSIVIAGAAVAAGEVLERRAAARKDGG